MSPQEVGAAIADPSLNPFAGGAVAGLLRGWSDAEGDKGNQLAEAANGAPSGAALDAVTAPFGWAMPRIKDAATGPAKDWFARNIYGDVFDYVR